MVFFAIEKYIYLNSISCILSVSWLDISRFTAFYTLSPFLFNLLGKILKRCKSRICWYVSLVNNKSFFGPCLYLPVVTWADWPEPQFLWTQNCVILYCLSWHSRVVVVSVLKVFNIKSDLNRSFVRREMQAKKK